MILVITVNYNNALLTNKTIQSILSNQVNDSFIDVIIVDNNSDDKEHLVDNKKVKIIYLKENIGYFPAINEALKQIDVSLYEYIIICNNDLIFEDNYFSLLMTKKFEDNIYSVSPRILDLDNIDQNPMLDKRISRFKVFFYDLYYKNYYLGQVLYKVWQSIKRKRTPTDLTTRQIFIGYGAIYILTKNFFQKNKLLETPPFLWFEETFLAYQIYKTGGIALFDSSLVVHHQDHSSSSKIPRKQLYNICKQSYPFFREKIFAIPTIN